MSHIKNSFLNRGFTRIFLRMSTDLSVAIRVLYPRQSALKKYFPRIIFLFLIFSLTPFFLKILALGVEGQTVVEYTAGNLRDPLDPSKNPLMKAAIEKYQAQKGEKPAEEVTLPPLSIQGIIWDVATPQAIIDDKVLKIGDTVKEAKVVDIKKEGVVLLFQDKKFFVKPDGSLVK